MPRTRTNKHSLKYTTGHDTPSLDISSLIDVCFLLLIYFIVTTTIQAEEQDLSIQLPDHAPSAESFPLTPPTITIREDQSIVLNQTTAPEVLDQDSSKRELPLLEERLRIFTQSQSYSSEIPVIKIDASDLTKQQRVIDVLNVLAKLKIQKIAFCDLEN